MKLLADENIEREFIETLRKAKFDVISVFEDYIGSTDMKFYRLQSMNRRLF